MHEAKNPKFSETEVTFLLHENCGWNDVNIFPASVYVEHECDRERPHRVENNTFYSRTYLRYIPERTCEWFWLEEWRDDEMGRECYSANWALDCGCWDWSYDELYDFDDIESKPTCWDYCPRCGARVVER